MYYWTHDIGYEGERKANKLWRLGDVDISSIRNLESGKGAHWNAYHRTTTLLKDGMEIGKICLSEADRITSRMGFSNVHR